MGTNLLKKKAIGPSNRNLHPILNKFSHPAAISYKATPMEYTEAWAETKTIDPLSDSDSEYIHCRLPRNAQKYRACHPDKKVHP